MDHRASPCDIGDMPLFAGIQFDIVAYADFA